MSHAHPVRHRVAKILAIGVGLKLAVGAVVYLLFSHLPQLAAVPL